MRAGVPTIITPLTYDQFDHAKLVNKLGCGIGLKDLKDLDEDEVAEALKKATQDREMQLKAKEISEQLRKEPGVKLAVEEIGKAVKKHRSKWTAFRHFERIQDHLREQTANIFFLTLALMATLPNILVFIRIAQLP